jgi:hypothetical protein
MKRHVAIVRYMLPLMTAAVLGSTAAGLSAQSLDSDSVNLAGRDFFNAYTSPDGSVREKARLYLLGVQDSTEGRVWCSYKRLKTVTLQEAVYEHFKKLPAQRLEERAAGLIEEMLAKKFPCGRSS